MQRLADPVLVKRAIARSGEPEGGEPTRLHRAWPLGDGGRCALWTDAAGSRFWPIIRPGKDKDLRALAAAVADDRAEPIPELAAYLLHFPSDPLIPQLAEILGRTGSVPAPVRGKSAPVLLGYKPLRRCVFRIEDAETVSYVKCVGRRRFGDLAAAYEMLGKADGLGFAKPERVWPRDGVVSWRSVEGAPLRGSLLSDSDALAGSLAETGRNLAALHTSGLRLPRVHDRRRELDTLYAWVDLAKSAFPPYEARLVAALADLEIANELHETGGLLPAHRDFHDGQVMITPRGAVFLDFDTASLAEAELDVGNFLAHLDLRGVNRSMSGSDCTAAAFIGGYRAAGGASLDGGRLDWYYASALLRLVCVYLFRPGGRILADRILDTLEDIRNTTTTRREGVI